MTAKSVTIVIFGVLGVLFSGPGSNLFSQSAELFSASEGGDFQLVNRIMKPVGGRLELSEFELTGKVVQQDSPTGHSNGGEFELTGTFSLNNESSALIAGSKKTQEVQK